MFGAPYLLDPAKRFDGFVYADAADFQATTVEDPVEVGACGDDQTTTVPGSCSSSAVGGSLTSAKDGSMVQPSNDKSLLTQEQHEDQQHSCRDPRVGSNHARKAKEHGGVLVAEDHEDYPLYNSRKLSAASSEQAERKTEKIDLIIQKILFQSCSTMHPGGGAGVCGPEVAVLSQRDLADVFATYEEQEGSSGERRGTSSSFGRGKGLLETLSFWEQVGFFRREEGDLLLVCC